MASEGSGRDATRTRAASDRPARSKKPENPSGREKSGVEKIKSTCVKLGIVLALILLIVLFWRNRVDWSPANIAQCARDTSAMAGMGEGFPVTVDGGGIIKTDEIADGIAVLSDNSFIVYSTGSKEAVSRAHFMSNPVMDTSGRYAVLADVGGRKYRLETISDTLVEGSANLPLLSCAASRCGRFAIVMQGSESNSSMLSTVEVYSRSGEWVHRWSSADYYITDAALSADGSYLAMCGISAADGVFSSVIIVQHVGMEGDVVRIKKEDNIFRSLEYTSNGTLFAVGSSVLMTLSSNDSEPEYYELNGEPIAIDIDYASGAAVYTSPIADSANGTLAVFDAYGKVRFTADLPVYGLDVSLSENGCCLLGREKFYGYRLDGGLLGQWDAGTTANGCVLSGRTAYITDGVRISKNPMHQQAVE